MRVFYFEKLDVWKHSKSFAIERYTATADFPNEEKFGLVSQIRRAAVGIGVNIAEGMSRNTNKDKSRFINIGFSSAIEVLNYLILARELDFLEEDQYTKLREMLEKITNQLNSLKNKLDEAI